MNFSQSISLIQKALLEPLPGAAAQHLMAPKARKSTEELMQANPANRLSSVMILLYPDVKGLLSTIFIEKPIDNSIHSGQVAFPGGKMDEEDITPARTALRETEEEIGVPAEHIQILGPLSQLFIPASNFLVIPHIGIMETMPRFIPNPDEVKSLIPTHVSQLMELKQSTKQFPTSYGILEAPYYELNGHSVWGATAMMISEFRELLKRC